MHYQHLKNFLQYTVRENDLYLPAMILYLVRNHGKGKKEEIAKLFAIFHGKYSLQEYELIVEKFAAKILEEYHLIYREGETYQLHTWPLKPEEINAIAYQCSQASNGFFSHTQKAQAKSEKHL